MILDFEISFSREMKPFVPDFIGELVDGWWIFKQNGNIVHFNFVLFQWFILEAESFNPSRQERENLDITFEPTTPQADASFSSSYGMELGAGMYKDGSNLLKQDLFSPTLNEWKRFLPFLSADFKILIF